MQTVEYAVTVEEITRIQKSQSARRQYVDVRSPTEFATGHIPGATNIPMEEIVSRIPDLDQSDLDEGVLDQQASPVLICQAGARAKICREWLLAHGLNCQVLQGGTQAWANSGLPLVRSARTRWSLERQVRLGAGLMTLAGALLAAFVHPAWVFLCAFAGLGLTTAGLTNYCPMAILLGRMPWNRS